MTSRTSTSLTDREGIAVVERIVTRDLRWFFREQSVVDQGIDAHVEVANSGHGTGRLMALQIKSGPSHFRHRVAEGWTFYYTERERTLWHGHALPVVVVLVDLATDTAYWQRISPATERRTRKRYAVTVPEHQTLSSAGPAWELAASGVDRLAEERYAAHLSVLPPQVASILQDRGAGGSQSHLIAFHLATGRQDPAGTARTILADRPVWMESDDGWPWAALGNYCAQHGALLASADALEVAAAQGPARAAERLAVAGLHAVQEPARARDLIRRAHELGGAGVPGAIAEAVLAHPEGDASPLSADRVVVAAGAAIHDNALAQAFLAEQAVRARDLVRAARYAQRALELEPDDSNAMINLAQICLRRAITSDAQADDLERATSLLTAAITQRRSWSGPTRDPLATLAQALTVQGRPEEALRWLLSPPHGSASEREAEDPELLRQALIAAHMAHSNLTASILEQMQGDEKDRVVQVRLGILELPDPELEALWTTELERAEAERDYTDITDAVLRLALLGVDASAHLQPLTATGVLPGGAERLPAAIALLRHHPEAGIERMRALATNDLAAAEHLVGALVAHGKRDEAIEACQLTFERFREPRFLTRRAILVSGDRSDPRAEDALREALQVVRVPADRLELATRLAALETDTGRWANAETRLTEAIAGLDPVPDDAVWNLVRVQLSGAAGSRAAATIMRYHPAVRDHDEARLWLTAMRSVPWDDVLASEAIALAARYDNHPKLAVALLSHVVMATRGVGDLDGDTADEADDAADELPPRPVDDRPAVPGDLHRKAFQALNALVKAHGEATGVQVLTVDPDRPLRQIEEHLRGAATPDLSELLDAVARGIVPAGAVAAVLGKTYSLLLVKQAAGQLVAVAMDDDEHQSDLEAASAALGSSVVVDLSTLLVLSRLTDAEQILGQFPAMLMPRSAHDDLLRTVVDVQGLAASRGSLDWDPVAERPVFLPQSDEDYQRLRSRTHALQELGRRTAVRHEQRSVLAEDLNSAIAAAPWAAAIDVAAHEGVALWCDDIGVRRLARSVGVSAFSTMAVMEASSDVRLSSASSPAEIDAEVALRGRVVAEMLAERVVDVPVGTDQVIDQARSEGWSAFGAAGVAVSRPAWWRWQVDPVQELVRIYSAVQEGDAARLSEWQYCAMLGAGRGLTADTAGHFLAVLALRGWGESDAGEPFFDDLVTGCINARRVAETLGIGDPMLALPAARASLAEAGVERTEEVVQALLAELGSTEPEA